MADEEISVAEAAKREGVRENNIRERIRRGTLPARKNGRAYVIKVSDLLANPKNNNQLGDGSTDSKVSGNFQSGTESPLTIARTKREMAQAQIKEMEARKQMGELIEKRVVEKSAFEMARKIRASLELIPRRISQEIAVETEPHIVEQILETEIRKSLEELSRLK